MVPVSQICFQIDKVRANLKTAAQFIHEVVLRFVQFQAVGVGLVLEKEFAFGCQVARRNVKEILLSRQLSANEEKQGWQSVVDERNGLHE